MNKYDPTDEDEEDFEYYDEDYNDKYDNYFQENDCIEQWAVEEALEEFASDKARGY